MSFRYEQLLSIRKLFLERQITKYNVELTIDTLFTTATSSSLENVHNHVLHYQSVRGP